MSFNNEQFGKYNDAIVDSRFNKTGGGGSFPPPPPGEVYLIDNDGYFATEGSSGDTFLIEKTI